MTVKVKDKPETSQAEDTALGLPFRRQRYILPPKRVKTLKKKKKKKLSNNCKTCYFFRNYH